MTAPLSAQVAQRLEALAGGLSAVGVALSGGGDSMALMHLAAEWRGPRRLMAATVDHRLRPESGDEARFAARAAAALHIPHEVLVWQHDGRFANLMADARAARLRLLGDWAARNGLQAVLLGHTLDDQAETVLMRLARGAGVDGLSGMAASRHSGGIAWLRPLLAIRRDRLRDWLRGQGVGWIDDPSNQNADYDRVRIRQAIGQLGLSPDNLAQVAENMGSARQALQHCAARICRDATAHAGALTLPAGDFADAPFEIRRRIIAAALRWVTGADYAPRRDKIAHLLDAIANGARATLGGVIVQRRGGTIRLIREPAAAMRATDCRASGRPVIWDNRWRIAGLPPSCHVRALGHQPLATLDWRAGGLSRDEAAASPAIWHGDLLIAAPLLLYGPEIAVEPLRNASDFHGMLISH